MTVKYRLLRPIVAMGDDGQLTTIPAGETVELAISSQVVGLCTVSWEGRLVSAFREDVRENAIALSDERAGWVN